MKKKIHWFLWSDAPFWDGSVIINKGTSHFSSYSQPGACVKEAIQRVTINLLPCTKHLHTSKIISLLRQIANACIFWHHPWISFSTRASNIFHFTVNVCFWGLFLPALNGNFPSKISFDCVQSLLLIFFYSLWMIYRAWLVLPLVMEADNCWFGFRTGGIFCLCGWSVYIHISICHACMHICMYACLGLDYCVAFLPLLWLISI